MAATAGGPLSAFESPTFDRTLSIAVDDEIGAASISPAGRDVVLASRSGLRIIDLDSPYSLPLLIANPSPWDVADVQWSPFAVRAEWIASTRNQLALVYNLSMPYNRNQAPVEYTLRAHDRAITDINFSAHHPDLLATCGVDSFVFVHDLRSRRAPLKLADFEAGATQVKWNRRNDNIIASAHDKYLHVWDTRRGATPLSTISAHSTKIYGIDWNRHDADKIMTCSLDTTIKLWERVGSQTDVSAPRRIIHTHYPVWRARHTPFPHGILAMPQRGNSSLWLYKHDKTDADMGFTNSPVHRFQGHEPDVQVREFLWRSRGDADKGSDNRDFQLISWGTDKHLHLHRISQELLEDSLNHQKGGSLSEIPTATRMGASYITYRNGPTSTHVTTSSDEFGPPRSQRRGNLSALLQNLSGKEESRTLLACVGACARETMTAQPIRRNDQRVVTHIKWMDGVKFGDGYGNVKDLGDRTHQQDDGEKGLYQAENDLGAEISAVGSKYKYVTFEHIDVPGRRITVSFHGPWGEYEASGEEHKLAFLRFTIRFPAGYPKAVENGINSTKRATPLEIEFQKTTAPISKERQDDITNSMNTLAESCAKQERQALEIVLSYALGERGLEDSLRLYGEEQLLDDIGPLPEGDSSSEDDEHGGEFADDAMQTSHTNVNVPLAVQCTVRFSSNGPLVIARMPSTKTTAATTTTTGPGAIQFRIARNFRHGSAKDGMFSSFGRITTRATEDSAQTSSPADSIGSWETSSSASTESASAEMGNAYVGKFQPPLAWQTAAPRFPWRDSLPSSNGLGKAAGKARSAVSILRMEELMPSKKALAEEYQIFGAGPQVCAHNAEVATKHGLSDLADIWMLCKLIVNDEVPLEVVPPTRGEDQVLVVARRALVRIKRKDSGLDLQFDEADTVTNPELKARTKWGHHIVVTWLIPALFDYFERLADTQMLAMLSCIFAEPAADEGCASSSSSSSARAKTRPSPSPMSMRAAAFSPDYFPSADVAWSVLQPSTPILSTPLRLSLLADESGWPKTAKRSEIQGSCGSSNGPSSSDLATADPVAWYSTGHTPPMLSSASSSAAAIRSGQISANTAYSTSPEPNQSTLKRSSTVNFASAVAALSRPFANALSSSPPVKSRGDELSTSAPTTSVTWGATTFYGSDFHDQPSPAPSRSQHNKRGGFGFGFGFADPANVDYMSDSDEEEEEAGHERDSAYEHASEYTTANMAEGEDGQGMEAIRVTLKNQEQFDDESHMSRPLLDASKAWLHRGWRQQYAELLGSWGLVSAKAEVLKLDGLVSPRGHQGPRRESRAGSVYLAVGKGEDAVDKGAAGSQPLSGALASVTGGSMKLGRSFYSASTSFTHFSFNPEATEFRPGLWSMTTGASAGHAPEALIPMEPCLHISIPAMACEREEGHVTGLPISSSRHQRQAPSGQPGRPGLARERSNVSGASSWGGGGGASSTTTTAKKKKTTWADQEGHSNAVYSCCICWIRVAGRFYLCATCGHVTHFDCMDDGLGVGDGDCVVGCGCGCGCGLPVDDSRSRMEQYLKEVGAAHATGMGWEEEGDWRPVVPDSRPGSGKRGQGVGE